MLKDLIVLLKELESFGSACNRCGMCQAVCPLFSNTGRETDVARGKLALIDGLISDILKEPDAVLKILNRCLLCGSCEVNCSRQVKTIELFIRARVIINTYKGLSGIKKIILQKIVANPSVFNRVSAFLEKYQGLFLKKAGKHTSAVTARFYVPFLKERNVQSIAPMSFQARHEKRTTDVDQPASVFYFCGCLIDKIMPEIGHASIKALRHHGYEAIVDNDEGCCGMPSLASGDILSFNRLVEHNINIFLKAKPDYIVTACATCTFTLHTLWPILYQGELEKEVGEMASRVVDITAFIVNTSGSFSLQKQQTEEVDDSNIAVTFHDPCHLKKSLNVASEPRDLIRSIPNYTLTEMRNADTCCGFGGSFSLSHYDLSKDIGALKRADIIQSNASIVASGCPACVFHINDQLSKTGETVSAKHVVELYSAMLPDIQK